MPTKKIKTYNGYTLEGSLNHPVLTKTGWVELKDLTKQHKVAIDYGSDIWGEENPGRYYNSDKYVHRNLHTYVVPKNTDLDIKLMYMIGYFLQKGRYSVNTKTGKIEFEFYLQNKNKRAETFWVHSSFLGSQFKKEIVRKDRNPVIKTASPVILGYLEHLKLGLENKVEDREIPDWIFRVPRELVISFLKGAFDSNGAILSINNKARSRILFYSRSERIAKTVQLLLLNLGIISKFKKEINRDNVTGEAPEYKHSLTIRGDSFNKFKEILGFKYSKYAEVLKKMKVCNYQNRYKVDDIYLWDKVIEVEESESLTYDFTVPNTNSYIGNGIVCHNTPKGKGTFFHQLYELEKTSPDWKSFHFTVYDNPFIPREEIERMKAIKSPKVFSQELMANWESFDAQMWTEMNSSHIIPHSELPSSYEEVLLGIDWGDVNPALIVAGYYNGVYYIIDYWENPNKGRPIEQHIHNKEAMRLVNEHYVSSSYADPSRPGFIMSMRRAGIPRLVSGYNRISEGNNVVNNLFYQNRIRISSKCQRVYDVFSAYHRAKKEEQILDEPAKFQDDHLCFVADTEIMTLEGWGKIQDIKIGDYVWTTKAWQPVISCMNRMASIITLQEIQHGGLLRCTPDHPFIQIDKRGRHIQHKAIDLHPGIYLKALDKKPDKPKLKVLPGEGRDMVYNITVKNAPEYYVRVQEHNGVLVHNCDAFRYIMATRHIRTLDKEMLQQPIQHRKEEEEVWETNSTLFSQD